MLNTSSDNLVKSWEMRRTISLATENMERRIRNGSPPEDAWNETSIQLAYSADAHCRAFIIKTFTDAVRQITTLSPQLHQVLLQLCELYAIYWILQRRGDFLQVRIRSLNKPICKTKQYILFDKRNQI